MNINYFVQLKVKSISTYGLDNISQGVRPRNIFLSKATIQNTLRFICCWLLQHILTVSAIGAPMYFHGFSFDTLWDAKVWGHMDYQVLDYSYGDSNQFGTHPSKEARETASWFRSQGIFGGMPRGDSLYVKWRDVATGKVSERTVDLRDRLPKDLTMYAIHFLIDDDELYVFLIPPPGTWQRDMFYNHGPEYEAFRKTHQIYPSVKDAS